MNEFSYETKCLLAWHEVFRRIGYLADELYVVSCELGTQIEVRHRGRFFVGNVATTELDSEEWRRAVQWWNTEATNEEHVAVYKLVTDHLSAVDLVLALTAKEMYPVERGS